MSAHAAKAVRRGPHVPSVDEWRHCTQRFTEKLVHDALEKRREGADSEVRAECACVVCARRFWSSELRALRLFGEERPLPEANTKGRKRKEPPTAAKENGENKKSEDAANEALEDIGADDDPILRQEVLDELMQAFGLRRNPVVFRKNASSLGDSDLLRQLEKKQTKKKKTKRANRP